MQKLQLRSGNQMVAEGAVAAGCRFFAGYPITPASGIYKGMIDLLQQRGDLAVSAPDEISALAYCVGASMRGFKPMTATSGPGWALMTETVQYALMTETPVVIALVQRLGPSTGGATQGAQGDLLFVEYCTSGGYTIPVFCPSTLRECYELTHRAFSCAEELRTPVVLLLDKEVGMTVARIDYGDLQTPALVNRPANVEYRGSLPGKQRMYEFADRSEVPAFVPVGGRMKVTATGSAHNKSGELKKNDDETLDVLYHLESKITAHADKFKVLGIDREEGAATLILSYGITARAMRESVYLARAGGKKVSAINVQSLFPVPYRELTAAAEGASRIIVAEENMQGQYRQVIEHVFRAQEVLGVNKIGSMITPEEISRLII
ncbi:MAG TPA: pyruvate flavodoxin/ferredoxin oxidoreductase [Bacteroidota bacterium]|nr:pyruvate flavodoxin/ferredoxin oxidoreductase [Bacteroidota bacterium]